MKIHKKLIVLVGVGMLLIMVITILSLQNITAVFSGTTRGVGHISLEVQRMWRIEKEMGSMSMYVHDFLAGGDGKYRGRYEASRAVARRMLNDMSTMDLGRKDMTLLASVVADFNELEKKTDRIFSLRDPLGADRTLAYNLMVEMDGLMEWMGRDIEKYKQESAAQMDDLTGGLRGLMVRVNVMFVVLLAAAVAFLLAFGLYLYQKVSLPLGDLWEGTEEISRGNLGYRIRSHGESDIAKLAERFNEMAGRLKGSYEDLERKLLARTKELAALNSVALALGRTGDMRDTLQNSLLKIVESLSGMEPRGGVFVCEPDGSALRLAAHVGLGRDFVRQEGVIRMGECLCGVVAQTGKLLYTGQCCNDPRHTRGDAGEEHAHIIIPIKSRGKTLGVVFLYPAKQFTINPSDIQLFDAIGSQLGIAVENARLYGEVKESSEKFWDLFENSRDIICTADGAGVLTAVNESMTRFLGYAKTELLGKSIFDFLTEDGAGIARRAMAGQRDGLRQPMEFEVVRRDGSHAFVEVSVREMRKDQKPVGFQISARDVTEQKQLREMLVKAERLAAIGQMGIAVRHEINNPLTTVIGNIELILDRHGEMPEDLKTRLQAVLENALRIAEIVKRLHEIKHEKTVEYVDGVKMTDLKKR